VDPHGQVAGLHLNKVREERLNRCEKLIDSIIDQDVVLGNPAVGVYDIQKPRTKFSPTVSDEGM
jgi:hypothetical protein